MRMCFPNALGVLAALGAVLYAIPSAAHELDAQLDCASDAHTFIASLQSDQFIEPQPMRVEANSVNAFRPTRGSELTAFGFRVDAGSDATVHEVMPLIMTWNTGTPARRFFFHI
jgi:hypothetical protein